MSDVTLRPARPDDDVDPLLRAAFGPAEGAGVAGVWADVAASDLVRASLVAVEGDGTGEARGDEGRVVGHVGLSHAWLDARRALVDLWLLAPLAVAPDRQGRGIGRRLLVAAVDAARAGGAPLLALEGDPAYYGAHGFAPAAAHDIEPASRRTPAPACQVVLLPGHEDWMSGRLVYPDAWWRHDCVGLRDPGLAQVEAVLGLTGAGPQDGSAPAGQAGTEVSGVISSSG
ncbi:GNAT family N-acetyltransferase [Agilicoccus flavus]|uniref:GNAT family N-acetyltransferase n=1 Tax=Agilicoccus flavus TaxID=2775968 RepID=UPI001CF6BDE6|nr:N-acetyltransferase [Agilicoccus flavus]